MPTMEDELWSMQQQSRVLQEFRAEIRPLWNDSVAREFDVRYLNAHESEDRDMVKAFTEQSASIDKVADHLERSNQLMTDIELLSQGVNVHLELCEQEIKASYQTHEQYRQFSSMAEDLFREVSSLVAEANTICTGVPTE